VAANEAVNVEGQYTKMDPRSSCGISTATIASMSLSGIGVSPELTEAFSQAVEGNTVRFIKVSINKGLPSLFSRLNNY
jgi:hypothetical protein